MQLSPLDARRFYAAWMPLLKWVNDIEHVVPTFAVPTDERPIAQATAFEVRKVLWTKDELRVRFVAENPMGVAEDFLGLVDSWKHRITEPFYINKHYARHSLFLDSTASVTAYEVRGISNPISESLPYAPVLVNATLLPFDDVIIYDSFLESFPVSFGAGARRMYKASYDDAKARGAVLRRLAPAASADILRAR